MLKNPPPVTQMRKKIALKHTNNFLLYFFRGKSLFKKHARERVRESQNFENRAYFFILITHTRTSD